MTQLPDYFVGARYRPARRPVGPPGPPPNLGFPSSIVGGPGVTVTLPPDMIANNKALYLQWTANVAPAGGGPQGWGGTNFYNAALFNSNTQGASRFQWNDTDNAQTFYMTVFKNGSAGIDFGGPTQRNGDKCVAVIPFVNGAQVSFSSYRAGVLIPGSSFTFGGGPTWDTVSMSGPASGIIALDHIPASIPQ